MQQQGIHRAVVRQRQGARVQLEQARTLLVGDEAHVGRGLAPPHDPHAQVLHVPVRDRDRVLHHQRHVLELHRSSSCLTIRSRDAQSTPALPRSALAVLAHPGPRRSAARAADRRCRRAGGAGDPALARGRARRAAGRRPGADRGRPRLQRPGADPDALRRAARDRATARRDRLPRRRLRPAGGEQGRQRADAPAERARRLGLRAEVPPGRVRPPGAAARRAARRAPGPLASDRARRATRPHRRLRLLGRRPRGRLCRHAVRRARGPDRRARSTRPARAPTSSRCSTR